MKEFKSTNNILMVEGKLFNWRKESLYYDKDEPYINIIDMGNIGDMYSAVYQLRIKKLCIYRNSDHMDFIAHFHCEDLYEAETIVMSFIKGSDLKLEGTIYCKTQTVDNKK